MAATLKDVIRANIVYLLTNCAELSKSKFSGVYSITPSDDTEVYYRVHKGSFVPMALASRDSSKIIAEIASEMGNFIDFDASSDWLTIH